MIEFVTKIRQSERNKLNESQNSKHLIFARETALQNSFDGVIY